MTAGLTETERDVLAELMASAVAPRLTEAVQTGTAEAVDELLAGLDWQDLAALVVVLAASHPLDGDGTVPGLLSQLCAERKRQGLTQGTVGARAGYGHRVVHYVERGRRGTRIDTVVDIAGALGLRLALVPAEATS